MPQTANEGEEGVQPLEQRSLASSQQIHAGEEGQGGLDHHGQQDQAEHQGNDDQGQHPVQHEGAFRVIRKDDPEGALQGVDQAPGRQQQGQQTHTAGGYLGLAGDDAQCGEFIQAELLVERGQQHHGGDGGFRQLGQVLGGVGQQQDQGRGGKQEIEGGGGGVVLQFVPHEQAPGGVGRLQEPVQAVLLVGVEAMDRHGGGKRETVSGR
jgi:hypothetical protein